MLVISRRKVTVELVAQRCSTRTKALARRAAYETNLLGWLQGRLNLLHSKVHTYLFSAKQVLTVLG